MKKAYRSEAGSAKLFVNFPAPEDMATLHKRDANQMAMRFFGNKYLDLGAEVQASTDRAYYVPPGFKAEGKFLVFMDVMSIYDPMSPVIQKMLHKALAELYKKSNMGPLPQKIKITPATGKGRLASEEAGLRSGLIRLAYENPDYRGHLVPFLTRKD